MKVQSIYQFVSKGYRVISLTFCLKAECLQDIPAHRSSNPNHTYPEFQNELAVQDDDDSINRGVREDAREGEVREGDQEKVIH